MIVRVGATRGRRRGREVTDGVCEARWERTGKLRHAGIVGRLRQAKSAQARAGVLASSRDCASLTKTVDNEVQSRSARCRRIVLTRDEGVAKAGLMSSRWHGKLRVECVGLDEFIYCSKIVPPVACGSIDVSR